MSGTKTKLFKDRHAAGIYLAGMLKHYRGNSDVVVLALPRGGVPVGYEIARELRVPMDIFIVRKLGVPVHEELAMGAIASGGVRVLNQDVIRKLKITEEMIEAAAQDEGRELERREQDYRGSRARLDLTGKVVILVDDGLATGASMRAAVQALKLHSPAKITIAVPVGAEETCHLLKGEVDELICGKMPENFRAVGAWYENFTQTTDEEVCQLIDEIADLHKVHGLAARHPEFSYFV